MHWRAATVAGVRPETSSARTVVLDVPSWPGHEAGQHVDIRLTADDGYAATRSYSIASVPDGDHVEITVERLANGEVSPYLVDDVRSGDRLEVLGPVGGWFVWRPAQVEPVLLVGGGSGLVPLMAMARRHRQVGSLAPLRLVYSVRDPDAMLYREELESLMVAGLSVTWVFTRRAPVGWPGVAGRIDASQLAQLAFPPAASPTAYVCGPTGFVEAVAGQLLTLGHDPRRVRTERFGPSGGSS